MPFAWSDILIDNLDNLKKYSNWTLFFILSTGIIMSSLANIDNFYHTLLISQFYGQMLHWKEDFWEL